MGDTTVGVGMRPEWAGGLYYTDAINANPPEWLRFKAGLPDVMIYNMTIDGGNTTLALWTRSRGAFVWPLPSGMVGVGVAPTITGTPPTSTPTTTPTNTHTVPSPTSTPTIGVTGTPTTCPMTFSDVQPSDYFYIAVRYLYCAGVISGYSDGTFRPGNNATRG